MTNLSPYGPAVEPTVDDDLQRYGFCVLRDIISKTEIAEIDHALDSRFAATPFCQGGFYGPRTKRFGGLLKRAGQGWRRAARLLAADLHRSHDGQCRA